MLTRHFWSPYGEVDAAPDSKIPGFSGHVADADTGLVYMGRRYYEPSIGRFLSVDPVTTLDHGDLRHFNRYVYAYNNPYKFRDPDGRCPSCDRFGDAFAKDSKAFDHPGFIIPAFVVTAAMAAPSCGS